MYTDKPTFTHIHPAQEAPRATNRPSDEIIVRCTGYYRVSTDRQGRSGLGLEAQKQAVSEFLAAKGWTLVGEYTEVESGKRKDRPRLAEAIEATKRIKGKLVIAKLDRPSRRSTETSQGGGQGRRSQGHRA